MIRTNMYKMLTATLCVALTMAALPTQSVAAKATACQRVQLPVALAPGRAATETLSGELCQPAGPVGGVDILIAGATYNHLYWDWPEQPELYSYVQKTLAAGRATFNFDRLGTGASSRPPSSQLTAQADAYVVHQIVDWLHSGTRNFTRTTLIGHSLGSAIAIYESATYHDAEQVVLTGLMHSPGVGLVPALASFYPAALDSSFFGHGYDLGYLTTQPNTRGAAFYSSAADPQVIAYDEAHKDVVATGEMGSIPTFLLPPDINVSKNITARVLVIAGQQDALVCTGLLIDCTDSAAVQANEAPYFPAAASVTTRTVPSTGHDLTLHPSANVSFGMINDWMQ